MPRRGRWRGRGRCGFDGGDCNDGGDGNDEATGAMMVVMATTGLMVLRWWRCNGGGDGNMPDRSRAPALELTFAKRVAPTSLLVKCAVMFHTRRVVLCS